MPAATFRPMRPNWGLNNMNSSGTLSITELVLNASFLVQLVMVFLLCLSVVSWTIIIQRASQYKQGRRLADEFEDKFWSGIDLNLLYQDCMKRQNDLIGMEVIYFSGFKEFIRLVNSGPADQEVVMDGTYRQMKVACSREVEALEFHLPTLATIGSISPYIGLFGTVWGIMHAFVALAAVSNATLSMVAPPIAEALIATAMGLFAAIPAVMFYNRFIAQVDALENRYLNFMDEFSTILNRRLVTIRSHAAVKPQNQAAPVRPQSTPAAPAQGQAVPGSVAAPAGAQYRPNVQPADSHQAAYPQGQTPAQNQAYPRNGQAQQYVRQGQVYPAQNQGTAARAQPQPRPGTPPRYTPPGNDGSRTYRP